MIKMQVLCQQFQSAAQQVGLPSAVAGMEMDLKESSSQSIDLKESCVPVLFGDVQCEAVKCQTLGDKSVSDKQRMQAPLVLKIVYYVNILYFKDHLWCFQYTHLKQHALLRLCLIFYLTIRKKVIQRKQRLYFVFGTVVHSKLEGICISSQHLIK